MISNQDLLDELLAMKEAGIDVSDGALNHALTDDLSEYEGIGVEQLASLFCEMYHWNRPLR
jgi:hypothetical protein